jgi:hypothetical protein
VLLWGNQGNDYINNFGGGTVWAGQGNDTVIVDGGGNIYGNEGDDRITVSHDVIASAGSGADTFVTSVAVPASTGRITDLDWSVDRIEIIGLEVDHATVAGAMSGATVIDAANTALLLTAVPHAFMADDPYPGGYTERAAVQFDYGGRTYLALDDVNFYYVSLYNGAAVSFSADRIVDITGVTGSISLSNFV